MYPKYWARQDRSETELTLIKCPSVGYSIKQFYISVKAYTFVVVVCFVVFFVVVFFNQISPIDTFFSLEQSNKFCWVVIPSNENPQHIFWARGLGGGGGNFLYMA